MWLKISNTRNLLQLNAVRPAAISLLSAAVIACSTGIANAVPNDTINIPSTPQVPGTTVNPNVLVAFGKIYSKPQIVHLAADNGTWAAIFGNGYNSPDNEAVLYVVDLASGNLLDKFVVSGDSERSGPNGLSTPTPADLNVNGDTGYVYADDLHGNMWRFDLSADNSSKWNVKLLHQTAQRQDNSGDKDPRPITAAPEVSVGPASQAKSLRGAMVFFGTGKLLEKSDKVDKSATNHFYGIWNSKANVDLDGTKGSEKFKSVTVGTEDSDELAHQSDGEAIVDGDLIEGDFRQASDNTLFDVNGDDIINALDKAAAGNVVSVAIDGAPQGSTTFYTDSGQALDVISTSTGRKTVLRRNNSRSGERMSWRQIRRGG